MRTQALVLAAYLLAAALPCRSAVASPASIAGELVMAGIELRLPMIVSVMPANQSAAQQLPAAASDGIHGIGYRLHQNWFSLLSEVTPPLAGDHPFVEQGIVLDHFLVFLVVFVVYIFR